MRQGSLLIVEDQPHFRRGLAKMIGEGKHGWWVAGEAANGRDAMRLLEQVRPDMVLSDIRMPVMDGIDFIGELKQRYPDMLVVFLTAYRSFEYAQAAVKLGALDYLVKPCSEEEVVRMLARASDQFNERMNRYRPEHTAAPEQGSPLPYKEEAGTDTATLLEKALAFLEEHYAQDCTLREAAEHMGLNPSYFSVWFKKEAGESFSRHMTRLRMEKAGKLLKGTDCKVSEIAVMVGYNEPNYFTNTFRQYYGISPKEYRSGLLT